MTKEKSFQKVFEHHVYLAGYALKLTQDQDDANDLLQETLMRAWRFWDRYEDNTKLRQWLTVIMKNQFTNDYRKKKLQAQRVFMSDDMMANVGHSFEIKEMSLSDETRSAIKKLSVKDQQVIMANVLCGFTYEETAALVKIPLGTVRSCLVRSKIRLAQTILQK